MFVFPVLYLSKSVSAKRSPGLLVPDHARVPQTLQTVYTNKHSVNHSIVQKHMKKNLIMELLGKMPDLAMKNKPKSIPVYSKFAINTELPEASKIGKSILERGGNAVDAAIGAGLAVGVVNLFSSGIGGGGFMLIRKKTKTGDVFDSFDFRETAPKSIDIGTFVSNPSATKTTGLAVAVPGEILGYYEAHRHYGRLPPWPDLFTDVIALAKGFRVSRIMEVKLNRNSDYIFSDTGLRELFVKNGRLVKEGETISRMNLARTLEILAENPLSFYQGELAEKTVQFINSNTGAFTMDDMKSYVVKRRPVLKGSFYDYDVYTTNLPTSGLFIIEAFKVLEKMNIRDIFKLISNDQSYYLYHMLIEIFKFMMADRGRVGDPDFLDGWQREVSKIISDAKACVAFKKLSLNKALTAEDYSQMPAFKEDHGTTHLNVLDSDEMAVGLTSTVNLEFGAKLMDPQTGILFNNQIDDFYVAGVDNAYGLPQMDANILEGGKRPFSSAAPTMLVRSNEMILIGAAGGTRIPTSIITTLMYFLAGNTLDKAVSSCRIHNQLSPNMTEIEPTLPDQIVEKLRTIGHTVVVSEMNTSFTSVQAIHMKKCKEKKEILAVSDHRKGGKSEGE